MILLLLIRVYSLGDSTDDSPSSLFFFCSFWDGFTAVRLTVISVRLVVLLNSFLPVPMNKFGLREGQSIEICGLVGDCKVVSGYR